MEEVKRVGGEERGRMAETPPRCDGERIGLVLGGPETLDPEVLNSAFGLQQCEQDDGRALGQEKQSVLPELGVQHNTSTTRVFVQ